MHEGPTREARGWFSWVCGNDEGPKRHKARGLATKAVFVVGLTSARTTVSLRAARGARVLAWQAGRVVVIMVLAIIFERWMV